VRSRARNWWSRLRHSLYAATHRRRVERDLDDEIRDHLDQQIVANVAAGMAPDEARRAALAAFGGVERIKDESRDAQGLGLVDALARLSLSWRALRRAPAFTVATVLTVALTVAAGATAYTVLDAILLRPLPYPHAERLVGLWHSLPGIAMPIVEQAPGTYWSYQRATRSFASIGAYGQGMATIEIPGPRPSPARVPIAWVTASLFRTLETRPLVGRLFADGDDRAHAAPTAILSEQEWRSRWHADPGVIGRTVSIDGVATEIIGVLPSSFAFPASNITMWVPFTVPNTQYLGSFSIRAIGRLRPGVTIAAAQQELQQILKQVPHAYPEIRAGLSTASALAETKAVVVLHPMRDDVIGAFGRLLWLVVATVAVMVLVALSNVASLSLARVEARQREFAVRTTLGASRGRIWRNVAGEAGLLSIAGGLAGAGMGVAVLSFLTGLGPTVLPDPMLGGGGHVLIPRLNEIHPDPSFALAALILTATFWLAITALGAWRLAAPDAAALLHGAGRASTAGRGAQRTRAALIAVEVAMSVTLLGGSAVLARSMMRLHGVAPGFSPAHVLTFWTAPPPATYRTPADISLFYRKALSAVRAVPGVEAAGIVSRLPLDPGWWGAEPVFVEHASPGPDAVPLPFALGSIGGDYLTAMRIPLLAGRVFDDGAVRAGAHEAVVTRGFAVRYWHDSTGARALGHRIRTGDGIPWFTIVGVVGAVRDTALTAPPTDAVYFPEDVGPDTTLPWPSGTADMAFAVQARGRASDLTLPIRRAIRSVDPAVPVYDVATMTERVSEASQQLGLMLLLLAVGAGATLALGVVGLYGVIAYLAALRTREIGIRIALGLTPSGAVRMLLYRGLAAVGVGALLGTVGFLAFGRLLRGLSFGVSPLDRAALLAAVLLAVGVGTAAVLLPAMRTTRIDLRAALSRE
jgi:putative ABC transport system permease protein